MAYGKSKGRMPKGKKSAGSHQGAGGDKKGKFAGGKSQVKTPMGKKAQTTTSGSPGGKGFAPKESARDFGSTRTPYDKTTPGAC